MNKKQQSEKQTIDTAKKLSIEETKEIFLKKFHIGYDPDQVYKELSEAILKVKNKGINSVTDKEHALLTQATYINTLENSSILVETIDENYRPFLVNFAQELIKEHECNTPSEKALVQTIVVTYGRIMSLSKRLNTIHNFDYFSSDRNGYFCQLSKDLDRANRQFIVALQTLKQIKAPPLQVNIKTSTAFIANNQQMIDNREIPNEINSH